MSIAVTKKNIKNMYIRVLPPDGKVQITVPYSAGDDAIRMFAVSRISWIKKQRANFEAQARQTKRQYVTGETYYVWGGVIVWMCNTQMLGMRCPLQAGV